MIKMTKSVRKFYLLKAITNAGTIIGGISLILGCVLINCSAPADFIGLILLAIGTIGCFSAGLAEILNPFDNLNEFLTAESRQETEKRIKKQMKWII